MDKIIVSVIIANKNGEKFLRRCLDSILEEEGNYEVVVVDDGSTDNSVEFLESYKNINLVKLDKNLGAAGARNLGVRRSIGKYLLFLDADTKIKPGWFDGVTNFFERNKLAGAAQVKLLTMKTNKFDYAGDMMGSMGFLIERARGAEDDGQFDEEKPIFSGKSAGMIMRRKVFNELKGFDEDYQIFLEDTDLFWRTWLAGYRVFFAPEIVVWHAFWTDEKPFDHYIDNQLYFRGCRNMITTQIKNFGTKRLWWNLPLLIFSWKVIALIFLFKGKPERFVALMKGIWWNIANLRKTLQKRVKIQQTRKISDKELFNWVGQSRGLNYYLGKLIAYTTGKSF